MRSILLLIGAVLVCPICECLAEMKPPGPLVRLDFSANATNTGSLGGEAVLKEYAAGQGPVFGAGARGTGLDLTGAARGGGSDNTKAGGAALIAAPSLARLEKLTATLWCKPIGPNAPARLFNLGPRADLVLSQGAISFKVRSHHNDVHFNVPRPDLDLTDGAWHFIALSHDGASGVARMHHASPGGALRTVATWSNVPPPDLATQGLEIGNFNGIRPFRGLIDSVRLYDAILPEPDLASIAAEDSCDARPGALRPAPDPEAGSIFNHSDVCFTSRSKHTNSVEMFSAFEANRLLWTYVAEPKFTADFRGARAETFQCAINSLPGTAETAAHAMDFDGAPMVAPWMRAFSRKSPVYWGCNNRPRFLEISVDRAKKAIDAGADMLQFDDWSLVVSASSWGGACFCENCMALFPEDIRRHLPKDELAKMEVPATGPFDYRAYLRSHHGITNATSYAAQKKTLPTTPHFEAFQRRSVREFFRRLGQRIDAIAGRHVPMSINSNLAHPSQQRQFIADLVDFVQGETLRFPLDGLSLAAKTAGALGKWHVFVTQSLDVPEARVGIASAYALGQLPMVPWDMYMGSDEEKVQPRGWGTPEQYGDLFHFVRANRQLFDCFESTAVAGLVINLDDFDRSLTLEACRRLLDAQVPFAIIPCGHSYFDVAMDAHRLSGLAALFVVGSINDLAPADRATLQQAATDIPILDPGRANDNDLKDLAIAEIWAPDGVHVIARSHRDPKNKTLMLHVLNRASQGREIKWISILLKDQALQGSKAKGVRWHAPGMPDADVETEDWPNGTRILIPRMREWGLAEILF